MLSSSILLIKKLSIFNISQKKKEFYFFLILNIFFFHFVLISLYEISIISNKNIVILIIIFLIFVIFFTRNFFLNLNIFQSLKFIYINLVLVFLSSLIILSNNGFKEVRLKAFKESYGGIEIDNGFLRYQSWSLLANYN